MLAAVAAVAVSGAFAACQYIPPTPKPLDSQAWAYKWKFSGKTTKAIKTTCKYGAGDFITRKSTSLKLEGWSLYCEPNCGDFEAAEATEFFWQTKPSKVLLDGGVELVVANVIGKKGADYEAAGALTVADVANVTAYHLGFAGLGKYDTKNARVKSIKGNFAGVAAAPQMKNGKDTDCSTAPTVISKVWECCGCPTADADSVAYGKWSVKYNKSMAKKYANGKLAAKDVLPKWAR